MSPPRALGTISDRVVGPAIVVGLVCVPILLLALGPWLLAGRVVLEFDTVDVLYRDVADRVVRGQVPYRDFLLEYPIGCLPQILLPRLAGGGVVAYRTAYVAEMLLANALLVLAIAREVGRREGRAAVPRRLAWYLVCYLFLCRLIVSRLDVVPALLGFLAAAEWFGGRPIRGGVFAAIGGLVKVVPALVVLPAGLRELSGERSAIGWRRVGGRSPLLQEDRGRTPCRSRLRPAIFGLYRSRLRPAIVGRSSAVRDREARPLGLLTFAGVFAIGLGAWAVVGGFGMLDAILFHAERGLEIESVGAGALMLAGRLTGLPMFVDTAHGSAELDCEWSPTVVAASRYVQLLAMALTLLPFARSDRRSGVRCTGALILAFIATAPVLSPQFLIWILPFAIAAGGPLGRRVRPLFALACALTFLIYPVLFQGALLPMRMPAILVLNLRNALILAMWALMAFGTADDRGANPG